MSKNKGKKQKYEAPELIDLGELARGRGQFCTVGSTAVGPCTSGGDAGNLCKDGSSAAGSCVDGSVPV